MNTKIPVTNEKARPNQETIGICSSPRVPIQSVIEDTVGFFSNYSEKERNILNTMFAGANNHYYISLSQATIARRSGCSVSTVKRSLPQFVRAGILGMIGRYKATTLFKVSDYFFNPRTRAQLSGLFRSFCYLPLMLLSVCNGRWVKDYKSVTARNELVYINSFIYKTYIINLLGINISNSTGRRTKEGCMDLTKYPNMHKRYGKSASNPWGPIVKRAHTASQKTYSDNNRPQCDSRSVKSDLSLKRERMATHDQEMRLLVAETKDLAPLDLIRESNEKLFKLFDQKIIL